MEPSNDGLLCPITLEIFRDPVVAQDGHTYERKAIEEWIQKNGTSPITNQKISLEHLVPNYTIKKVIDSFENSIRAKDYQYTLDVDVKKKKGRPLFQTSGKTIYHADWLPTNEDRPEIVLLKIDGARANKEASFYVNLSRHPHIVRTFGIVREDDNDDRSAIMLLQEYASEGSLYELLNERKKPLDEKILIEIFLQIIDAMSYLALNNVVHGDLACRNVLVFRFDDKDPKTIVVKVTDFGLSRYSKIYTQVTTVARTALNTVPVRYSAPEILSSSVTASNYTEKSDVYAMGVLMWEAYSRGAVPWSDIENDDEVIRRVRDGHKLPQPPTCSSQYWNIITKTWSQLPNERPTFDQLKQFFKDQLYPATTSVSKPDIPASNPSLYTKTSSPKSSSKNQVTPVPAWCERESSGFDSSSKQRQLQLHDNTHGPSVVPRKQSTARVNYRHDEMLYEVVQFGKDLYTIKGYIKCGNQDLFGLECERPMPCYDGLCPICREEHLKLSKSRGYYVSVESVYAALNIHDASTVSKNTAISTVNSGPNEMVEEVVQFAKHSYTIKGYITCGNQDLFALECERPMSGYNGLCPLCQREHIRLSKSRGYYVPIDVVYEALERLDKLRRDKPPLDHPITGDYTGIQGDSNSSYMDSTIFCMFAYSAVFDSLLHMDVGGTEPLEKLQKLLRENIVNVLRSEEGFVERDALFYFRQLLSDATNDKSFIEMEKDPSEFLRALEQLFHYAPLKTVPPNQPPKQDKSNVTTNIIWEMFDANPHNLLYTNIADIFRNSLAEIPVKLASVPPFLILIAPRHARSQRSYRYIVPDRQITLDHKIVQLVCLKCQRTNHHSNKLRQFYFCNGCYLNEPSLSTKVLNNPIFQCYCDDCLKRLHNNLPTTQHIAHEVKQMNSIAKLNLFAVLCVETCHYVAFVKCYKQNQQHEWLFFDGASDRINNEINVSSVSTLPKFDEWIDQAETDKDRFFEDLNRRRSQGKPLSQAFREDAMRQLRLFRDGAFFFYEDADVNYH